MLFFGSQSGHDNTSGYDNAFFGLRSGYKNDIGYQNSFFGVVSGKNNISGYYNTFFGYGAGYENTQGRCNTYLGYNAGRTNSIGDSNIFIGHQAGYYETGSQKLYIDIEDTQEPLIFGDFKNDTVRINGILSADVIDGMIILSNAITSNNIKTGMLNVSVDKSADYVFDADYNLRPLSEVEEFVKDNKHLPGIPAGKELEANGMDVARMNNLLLEKIEELTLYIIDLEKNILNQEKRIADLERKE